MDETAHTEHGVGQVCGKVTSVDRANARPAKNVDLRRCPAHAGQIVEDVPENADLVRPARPTPREDHRGSATRIGLKSRHHEWGLPPISLSRSRRKRASGVAALPPRASIRARQLELLDLHLGVMLTSRVEIE